MHDDRTAERIAENQSRFREANDRIEIAAERASFVDLIPFLCECPDLHCTQIVRLTLEEYEAVRHDPARFFTAFGHQAISLDAGAAVVIDEKHDYVIIDKIGKAGEIAAERYRDLTERGNPS